MEKNNIDRVFITPAVKLPWGKSEEQRAVNTLQSGTMALISWFWVFGVATFTERCLCLDEYEWNLRFNWLKIDWHALSF